MEKAKDSKFFLRFAITPYCNFKCFYCNPDGKRQDTTPMNNKEIMQIIEAGMMSGVNRVHWTGGEPTIVKGLLEMIKQTKTIGYTDQVLTTNGSAGGDYVRQMQEAGLNRLIVSLDTLDRERFKNITQRDSLDQVLDTIETAVTVFDEPTKVNIVYFDETRAELPRLIEFGQKLNKIPNKKGSLIVKLLEMTKMNPAFYDQKTDQIYDAQHSEKELMMKDLSRFGTPREVKVIGNNPSTHYYDMPELGMTVGMINIPSEGYRCGGDGCAKIRLNPYGMVAVCVNHKPIDIREKSVDEQANILTGLMEYREIIKTTMPNRKHQQQNNFGYWRFGDCGVGSAK